MKSKVSIIFLWIAVAVVLIYLAANVLPSVFSTEELTVESAESIVFDDCLNVTGIALRDEVTVSAAGSPSSIDYKVSDGDRVSIGDIVATYSSEKTSAEDRLAVESIDRQIELLNDCISATTQYDLKTLDSHTKDSINRYLSVSQDGNLSSSLKASSEVVSYFVKRDIKATGDKSYYQQILTNCESSRKTILNGNSARQTAVSASHAGYFSSQFDGYESLKSSDYSSADPATVHSLLLQSAQTRPSNYIGKLQHFSYWTYLCTVPSERAELFAVGSSWKLRFETAAFGLKTVTMTVANVSEPSDGEVALLFECSSFDQALYSLRICDAQIVLKSYSGFKVRQDAIRVSEGKTGVYVLSGAKLVFKPITVLYSNDDRGFAVVEPNSKSTATTLFLNDSVVIGGKEISDGKVVNIQ